MTNDDLKNQRRELKANLMKAATDTVNVKTSNIIHLILSCITAGAWLIVWLICFLVSAKQRKSLQLKTIKYTNDLYFVEELIEGEKGFR
tara:strand:+ start:209 stop:475 length:267 start_codon:yes stop_codon:yes gene_type:complete